MITPPHMNAPQPRNGNLTSHYWLMCAVFSAVLVACTHVAMAQNLVTNGSFAISGGSTTQSFQFGSAGGYAPSGAAAGETLPGWATTSYAYVFTSPAATALGAYNAALYNVTNAPNGGNFIAEDTDPGAPTAITQTVGGLVQGRSYTLSFYWAGAEQTGYSGTSTEKWNVTLGGSPTQSTIQITDPSQGFTGWNAATMTFVATTTGSEVLSFVASSSQAVPPFALLANVSLVQTPEPASAALLAVGIIGLIGLSWRQRASVRGRVAA